ncbi:cysteine desulfurase SufS [Andreesenia angusta]|uniref:cysteine desulfurase n=1 Tax=Andreesenia angusta TaxID=39480 RepID=A0A1S1V3Y0_9FIRM|nr:aminotransferase class V-fold PLP-dependent enzyme [Andreesenia angusta]OHW61312.1 cysteine desulfurase SufS [Andreesenia angusta]
MIYLDNAATTFPKPEEVYARVSEVMRFHGANPGRSGHSMALEAGRIIYNSREVVAKFFNIKNPMQVVFTSNATEALNIGIKGVLEQGDHAITSSMEHNSVLRPLKALEKKGIIELTIVDCNKSGEISVSDIERAIKDNTKLIVTTHASNVTGTIFPIEEIAKLSKSRGILYMVDAAQTAGVYSIDVEKSGIDMLAFAGHKSLLGPQGTGGIYIREGLHLDTLKEGGTGSKSESLYQPEMMPDRFESGTPNTPGIAGLAAGIEFINSYGIDKIRTHEEELTKYFIDSLSEIEGVKIYGPRDISKRAPVVSINIGDEDSSEVGYIMDEAFGIGIRPGLHCAPLAHKTIGTFEQGTVRFSFGLFTKKEELDRAIEGIKEIVKSI